MREEILLDTAEMDYNRARKNLTSFLSLTGVKVDLFDQILPFFKAAHDEYFHWHDVKGKKMSRRRSHCIQSNSPLATIEERLFFILTFLKNNPTQEYHAAGFDMSQQQCGQWIHTLSIVLRNAAGTAGMLPAETLAEFKKVLEERGGEKVLHELIHDTTEREIPRPCDPEVQADFYSGKKKKHTVKNVVITTLTRLVLFVGATVPDKTHDKTIAETQYAFPYPCILWQDSGYQGYAPRNTAVIQPTKKPRGKELSTEQKAENKVISSTRIKVEHAISGIKNQRVVKDLCRLRKNHFVDKIFSLSAGIHNWRLSVRR